MWHHMSSTRPKHHEVALLLLFGAFLAVTQGCASVTKERTGGLPERIPTISVCDLAKRPKLYVDRKVRLRASYIVWWESAFLYSLRCNREEAKIGPEFQVEQVPANC